MIDTREEIGKESVSKILSHHRWESEVGVKHSSSREKIEPEDMEARVKRTHKETRGKKSKKKALRGRGSHPRKSAD